MQSLIGSPRCGACRFAVENERGGGLTCRRNPPTAVVLVTKKEGRPVPAGDMALWPRVGPEHWCGEFGRRLLTAADAVEGQG